MKVLHTHATLLLEKLFKLERCGKYDEALIELQDIWDDTSVFPDVKEFESRAAAEVILRCGSLIGFLGHNNQIPNSQEKSKNLLTEALSRFQEINEVEKMAECENYVALAYWRTGELVEAETWIEESLGRDLADSSSVKIYSLLIKSMILIANEEYEKAVSHLEVYQTSFLMYGDDFLNGSFCTNLAVALKNLGDTSEALKRLELARYYHQKSRHQIYLGTVGNNLAQLYKSENKFSQAHEAIDSASKVFKKIKDRTREAFSLDTKAQIYFAERKYAEALKSAEKAVDILKKGENKKYLVESYLTKAKTLIYLEDDISTATLCLSEAIELARNNISEEAARDLVREFEKTRQEKSSPVVQEISLENKTENKTFGENLELVLPKEISHYNDIQGVWIKNNHLEAIGLQKDSLAVVVKENVKPGDLVAITEIANDSVSCGFYDSDFGIVCLEGTNSELQLFDEKDIKILGKIVGVCKAEKSANGKMFVEPINL
jgi:tetratricopeptide (TPR) repeat protein